MATFTRSMPGVDVLIAGKLAHMLVDTGASRSFLTSAAVWYFGLERKEGMLEDPILSDESFLGDVVARLRFADPNTPRIPEIVAVVHTPLGSLGFAGAIAPQELADDNSTVLIDLRRGQIAVLPGGTIALDGIDLAASGVRRCRDQRDPRFTVRARIGGRSGWLLVDTGASSSSLHQGGAFEGLAEGWKVADWQRDVVGALRIEERLPLGEREIWMGKWKQRVDLSLTTTSFEGTCEHDGVLGMDVLRHCVIAWSQEQQRVVCSKNEPVASPAVKPSSPAITAVGIRLLSSCKTTSDEVQAENREVFPVHYDSPWHAFTSLRSGLQKVVESLWQECLGAGHLSAKRVARLVRRGRTVSLEVGVEPGEHYRLGEIRVVEVYPDGERVVEPGKVHGLVDLPRGSPATLVELEKASRRVVDHYRWWARPYMWIAEKIYLRKEDATVDVEIRVCLAHPDQVTETFRQQCDGDKP